MSEKAEWRKRNFKKKPNPPEDNYELFEELTSPDGIVIACTEQFKTNLRCFYATTPYDRSGCLASHDWARQWCETKTNNKVN